MIADYADKLNTYEEFKDYADMVQQFIKKQKEENLPEGRYDLKNGIFALVQKYTTKSLDGAQMESHKKYCDLQYIVEGTEKIYWASLRKLTVEDDRTMSTTCSCALGNIGNCFASLCGTRNCGFGRCLLLAFFITH